MIYLPVCVYATRFVMAMDRGSRCAMVAKMRAICLGAAICQSWLNKMLQKSVIKYKLDFNWLSAGSM